MDKTLALLLALEWSSTDPAPEARRCAACPSCHGVRDTPAAREVFSAHAIGHRRDCELAAQIKALSPVPRFNAHDALVTVLNNSPADIASIRIVDRGGFALEIVEASVRGEPVRPINQIDVDRGYRPTRVELPRRVNLTIKLGNPLRDQGG